MEEEKKQDNNAFRESSREGEDAEECSPLTTEWPRLDKEQRDVINFKDYERKGKKLSEALTKLMTIITGKRVKMQHTMELIQETEDDLRLGLIQLRVYMRKAATHTITEEEKEDWEREEYRLKAQLTELEMWIELQGSKCGVETALESHKSEEVSDREAQESELLIKAVNMMSLLRRDKANQDKELLGEINEKPLKAPLKCFYCHEEGHFKRNCAKRQQAKKTRNRGGWHQSQGGKHVIRGQPSWYRGSSHIRRPRGQVGEVGKEVQQPFCEYDRNERQLAEAREHNESMSNRNKNENERVRNNPLM